MPKKKPFEIVSAEDLVRQVSSWIVDVILVLILAFFLTWAFGSRVTAEGSSMTPLIADGDKLMINRLKGRLVPVERFDIAAYSLDGDDSVFLKLVLALPGETIQIKDGKIYIDNTVLDDPRARFPVSNAGIAEEPILLHEGEYFVIGRSPDASRDSRFADVGNIRSDHILGAVWLRYAPFSGFGRVQEAAVLEES